MMMAGAAAAILAAGCSTGGCTSGNDPIVHPTDEQINQSGPGGQVADPPYTPWWAEKSN